jgi:hypothetical protein
MAVHVSIAFQGTGGAPEPKGTVHGFQRITRTQYLSGRIDPEVPAACRQSVLTLAAVLNRLRCACLPVGISATVDGPVIVLLVY